MNKSNNTYRYRQHIDLCLIICVAVIVVLLLIFPASDLSIIRALVGAIYMLFAPGYAALAALFPKKTDMSGLERFGFSFALSLAVLALFGFALNYSPYGISQESVIICLTIFTIFCSMGAFSRRNALKEGEYFAISLRDIANVRRIPFIKTDERVDYALGIILVLCILLAATSLLFVIAVPKSSEHSTEFYILGSNGEFANYTTQFIYGKQQPVNVNIINHEGQNKEYNLVIRLSDANTTTTLYSSTVQVADTVKWNESIGITPNISGQNLKMEFLLYKDDNPTVPYRTTYLWVNVS